MTLGDNEIKGSEPKGVEGRESELKIRDEVSLGL
jgi:hypothetical protein